MWKKWFPSYDVPKTIERLVSAGVLRDGTHEQDATPHFEAKLADGHVILWVDHPNREHRYFPDGPRYMLDILRPGRPQETLFESDVLDEVLILIRDLMKEGKGLRRL